MAAGAPAVGLELGRGDEFQNGDVLEPRLKILAQGKQVAANAAQVGQGRQHFGLGLAQAEHKAGLGVDALGAFGPSLCPGPSTSGRRWRGNGPPG